MADRKSSRLNFYSSNIVNLCVDSWGREGQRGTLYHQYAADGITFLSLYEALDRMEQLYNMLRYPQTSAVFRSFAADCRTEHYAVSEAGRIVELSERRRGIRREFREQASLQQMLEKRGAAATFFICVQYRQHYSWQGEITWVEKQQKRSFRSVLELLRLINSALDPGTKKR